VTEFAEPILVEISSRPPDLEDNFGWDTGAWVVAPWGAEWRKSIKNGEIILSQVSVQYQGIKFHDYVVQVRVRRIEAGWHGIEFGNYPVHPPSEVGFSCLFKVLGRNAHFSCSLAGKFTDIDREIATQPIHTFLLIVKGGRIATYLDGKPISYFEDDRYRLYRDIAPSFWLSSGSVHAFSEFKVWNITKLEVP
jgi:hypothetical protein